MKTLYITACLIFAAVCIQPLHADSSERLLIEDMDGVSHDVTAALDSGRRVAFVFWQTWCASCKKEAPAVAAAAREYHDSIRFYGVVSGPDEYVDEEKVRAFVSTNRLPYPQVRDRDLSITRAFKVKGTPTIVVLGEGLKVLYRGHHVPDDWGAFLKRKAVQVAPERSRS